MADEKSYNTEGPRIESRQQAAGNWQLELEYHALNTRHKGMKKDLLSMIESDYRLQFTIYPSTVASNIG